MIESRATAIQLCRDLGQRLKVEHIEQGRDEQTVSYRQGATIDSRRSPPARPAAIGASSCSPSPRA